MVSTLRGKGCPPPPDDPGLILSEEVKRQTSPHVFETWFQDAPWKFVPPDRLILCAKNNFHRVWVERNFGELLRTCARSCLGEELQISFEVTGTGEESARPGEETASREREPSAASPRARSNWSGPGLAANNLNRELTFENFVVGASNNVPHAASIAVSDYPGKTYNPLVIYGEPGAGKTHLLHAICHRILDTTRLRVSYLTSEQFLNQYIQAVADSSVTSFRDQLRQADVLAIDDLQFLSSKDKTQDELFHIFNALQEETKQIIFSSRSSPREMAGMQERLKSRLGWGLVARIGPPTFETRVAILMRKARSKSQDLPMEVAEFIAAHVTSNVRELEGALSRLMNVASFQKSPLDIEVAKSALSDLLEEDRSASTITVAHILRAVQEYYQLKPKDLLSRSKVRSVAFPRQVGMFLARDLTQLSLSEIGMHFGGRDHATVLYAQNRVKRLLKSSSQVRCDLQTLKERIASRSP